MGTRERRSGAVKRFAIDIVAPCLLALAVAGSLGCASRAANASTGRAAGDWSAVKSLAPWSAVVVERHGASTVAGAVRAVSDASIEIDSNSSVVVVARADVARVLRTRSRRAKGAVRGLAIGAVGGVLQGLLLTESNRVLFAGLFGAGWAAIGASLGAISGAGSDDTVVVYSAQSSNSLPNIRMQPTRRMSPDAARLIRRR